MPSDTGIEYAPPGTATEDRFVRRCGGIRVGRDLDQGPAAGSPQKVTVPLNGALGRCRDGRQRHKQSRNDNTNGTTKSSMDSSPKVIMFIGIATVDQSCVSDSR